MNAFKKAVALYLYVYIIVSGRISFTLALSKTWIQNNNWENTRNWNPQRLPCADDIVEVHDDEIEIFLNSTSRIKALTFPGKGSIALGDSAEIVFIEENSDSESYTCKGGEISFIGFGSDKWFDPYNWQSESAVNKIDLYSSAVPCQYDVVTFPKDSSYNVNISRNVTVANIFINGKQHSENEFEQYVVSHTGVQQIHLTKSASFHITGEECRDISGCICDSTKYEDYICSFVPCPKLQCDQSVKPFGGCCSICGNLLLVNFSTGFNKASIEKQIQTYLKKFPEVTFTSMKFEKQRIQIILWDDSNPGDSKTVNAAHAIRENLLADEKTHIIAIDILPRQSPGSAEGSKSKSVDAITIGSIAGGVVVFIVLVVVIVVILYKRKNSRQDVNIVERNNEDELNSVENPAYQEDGVNSFYEVDLEMDTVGYINALSNEESSAMENPLYESGKTPSPVGD